MLADVDGVSRYSAKTFHCWVNCGRRFGLHARTWPDGLSSGTSWEKPVASEPGPVVESYCAADSKKNGGFSGSRKLAPVPSMYCEIPYAPRYTHRSLGRHANPSRGSKPFLYE